MILGPSLAVSSGQRSSHRMGLRSDRTSKEGNRHRRSAHERRSKRVNGSQRRGNSSLAGPRHRPRGTYCTAVPDGSRDCSIVTHVSPRGLLVPSLVFLALRECIWFLGDLLSRAFEFQSSVSSASVISSRRKAKDQAMLLGMDRLGGPVFRLFFSHLM